MKRRLIDANRLIKKAYRSGMWNRSTQAFDLFVVDAEDVEDAPTIDAVEVVRHEGNTTFVTTDNLDAYTDRIIVVQGNWCKVYYRDSDDTGEEG